MVRDIGQQRIPVLLARRHVERQRVTQSMAEALSKATGLRVIRRSEIRDRAGAADILKKMGKERAAPDPERHIRCAVAE